MANPNMTIDQTIITNKRENKRILSKKKNFKSPDFLYKDKIINYYFSNVEVEKILNAKGEIEIDFVSSACQYENYIENLLNNEASAAELLDYPAWIKVRKFKINILREDFTPVDSVSYCLPYAKKLRELSGINFNLPLNYPWFFFFFACWFKNQHCDGKGGIGYTNHEADNKEYRKYLSRKKFIHKDFEIKKGKHYVFRISVEAGGLFEILHHDEFIYNLIFLVSRTYPEESDIKFNDRRNSVHFIYISDEFCTSEEIVILSMQFFDL